MMNVLKGKIGQFGDSVMSVAKNISKDSIRSGYDKYLRQSPEELAEVARKTMLKKNTVASHISMDDFDNVFASSTKKGMDGYTDSFNKLRGSLNSGNIEEASKIATDMSSRFEDGEYIKLFQSAEGAKLDFDNTISSVSPDIIGGMYKNSVEMPGALKNFASDKEQNYKNFMYSAQGKRSYFNSGDSKTNRIRAGVVGGAYMGTMTTARLVQGGGLTSNEYGERDIVGVPFI